MDVQVNLWAVILAAASSMVVGSIWYSKSVFGTAWGKLAKVKMDRKPEPQEMFVLLGTTFIASLITAYVIAHVAYLSNQFFGNGFVRDAVATAFWLWLGLVATRLYVYDAFEGRRKLLTILNSTHELVTLLVMGLVIGLMGV